MLNAKNLPSSSNSNRPKAPPLDPGSYPVRLVQVVTLGIQKQNPYEGEPKPPALQLRLTYEFLDEFLKDDEGNDLEDKPRWLSEEIKFMSLKADLATSTKRYYALDPEDTADGDWTKLIASPAMANVVQKKTKKGDTINKIAGLSAMRPKEASKAPDLKNPALVWDFYTPDVDVFKGFPQWLQERIKEAVDYPGSALEKALQGASASKPDEGSQKEKKPSKVLAEAPVEGDEDW